MTRRENNKWKNVRGSSPKNLPDEKEKIRPTRLHMYRVDKDRGEGIRVSSARIKNSYWPLTTMGFDILCMVTSMDSRPVTAD